MVPAAAHASVARASRHRQRYLDGVLRFRARFCRHSRLGFKLPTKDPPCGKAQWTKRCRSVRSSAESGLWRRSMGVDSRLVAPPAARPSLPIRVPLSVPRPGSGRLPPGCPKDSIGPAWTTAVHDAQRDEGDCSRRSAGTGKEGFRSAKSDRRTAPASAEAERSVRVTTCLRDGLGRSLSRERRFGEGSE